MADAVCLECELLKTILHSLIELPHLSADLDVPGAHNVTFVSVKEAANNCTSFCLGYDGSVPCH